MSSSCKECLEWSVRERTSPEVSTGVAERHGQILQRKCLGTGSTTLSPLTKGSEKKSESNWEDSFRQNRAVNSRHRARPQGGSRDLRGQRDWSHRRRGAAHKSPLSPWPRVCLTASPIGEGKTRLNAKLADACLFTGRSTLMKKLRHIWSFSGKTVVPRE